ncbi:UvrB/UvrC motif-containing protein [Treponema pectinovorum]|uniref:UvrB/UvrC motif-containing protein n=1 Tax=Treponema pectinovorum TaxID=164 RepID=UPI0011C7A16B|nr:UvrB/UvrC motif-containing protein [Treponema pectinovorum]
MNCDFCQKNEAFVFIELQGPVIRKKLNLCRECSQRLGIMGNHKEMNSLFKELTDVSNKIAENDNKACPVCGNRLAEIKKNKVGCGECYSIFKDEIRTLLKKQGITGSYTGLMPHRLSNFRSVLTDRIVLQTKLEESIKKEDYEKAAVYRDYLRALEKTPVNNGEIDE